MTRKKTTPVIELVRSPMSAAPSVTTPTSANEEK
jgi:hypothetical protein